MLDILERVKLGSLPKASALVALGAAFPDMRPETAAGMVEPIEITGPVEEPTDGTPPAPTNIDPPSAAESSNENGGGVSSPDESGNSNDDGTEGNSV